MLGNLQGRDHPPAPAALPASTGTTCPPSPRDELQPPTKDSAPANSSLWNKGTGCQNWFTINALMIEEILPPPRAKSAHTAALRDSLQAVLTALSNTTWSSRITREGNITRDPVAPNQMTNWSCRQVPWHRHQKISQSSAVITPLLLLNSASHPAINCKEERGIGGKKSEKLLQIILTHYFNIKQCQC